MIENGDLIIRYLERLGVEYVFGVPGGSIEPFLNALARSERSGGPRAVIARHETGAAFMAEGYARETGKLGVCFATSGPGATNMVTGVASAYADAVPMIVITAQTSLQTFGLGALQEGSGTGINTVSIFEDCTRFNSLVSHPSQLERKLLMAISYALSSHPGPVHLSVPIDVMRAPAKDPEQFGSLRAFINHEVVPPANALNLLLKELADKDKVTLLIGEGAAEAIEDILALAESRQWLLVATPRAKGLLPEYHPLYRGVFGFAGHESARLALQPENAQRVLVIGTALDEVTTGGWDTSAVLSNRLIHVSNSFEHLSRSTMARLCILGSPVLLIEPFTRHLQREADAQAKRPQSDANGLPLHVSLAEPAKCHDKSGPLVKPQALYHYLSTNFAPEVRIYADSGCSYLWGIHYWMFKNRLPNGKSPFQVGIGFSSMGWAIGAAVGAAVGAKGQPVVCITGDGSMLMSGQEITTALQERLNIMFIVLNDAALGMVRHGQKLGGAEQVGHELPPVDFALMAQAMGVPGYRVESFEDLEALDLNKLLTSGPCLLDIRVDAEQVPPMGARMKALGGN